MTFHEYNFNSYKLFPQLASGRMRVMFIQDTGTPDMSVALDSLLRYLTGAGPGISPPNFLVSPRKKILGAGLSTNSAEFVNRQSVRIQGANFQFASPSKASCFAFALLRDLDSNQDTSLQRRMSYH